MVGRGLRQLHPLIPRVVVDLVGEIVLPLIVRYLQYEHVCKRGEVVVQVVVVGSPLPHFVSTVYRDISVCLSLYVCDVL